MREYGKGRDRTLTVRLEPALSDRLREHAAQLNRTPSELVRSVLAATLIPAQPTSEHGRVYASPGR
jgi:predicted transcriptional regulator